MPLFLRSVLLLSFILIISCKSTSNYNSETYWTLINESIDTADIALPTDYKAYVLELHILNKSIEKKNKLTLPLPTGDFLTVTVKHSSTMSPELAKKYPGIKSLEVLKSDKIIAGRIDINPSGFYAMLTTDTYTYYINPIERKSNRYVCYEKRHANKESINPFFEQPKN